MILIIGGAFQGKRDYVLKNYNINLHDVAHGGELPINEIIKFKVVDKFHLTVKNLYETPLTPPDFADIIFKSSLEIIIIDEVGLGIVPISSKDRGVREYIGRVATEIAARSREVIRITWGLPFRLK